MIPIAFSLLIFLVLLPPISTFTSSFFFKPFSVSSAKLNKDLILIRPFLPAVANKSYPKPPKPLQCTPTPLEERKDETDGTTTTTDTDDFTVDPSKGPSKGRTMRLMRKPIYLILLLSLYKILPNLYTNSKYYLPGAFAASLSHTLTVPIDVIKTRQQIDEANYVHSKFTTSPEKYKNAHHSYSVITTARKLVEEEGCRVLLKGLSPTLSGYFIEGSLKFGSYEFVKSLNYSLFSAGLVSGILASVVLCPMEALRIRMVSELDYADNMKEGMGRMFKESGFRGLFRGLNAMMAKQIPYTIVKQVSFDVLAPLSLSVLRPELAIYAVIGSAFVSSVLSTLSSHPGDMLLSVVNSSKSKRQLRTLAREILERDGVKGFFTGLNARFLHVGLIVTVQLVAYDFFRKCFGLVVV